ncbi:MAG TPA: ParA family protein [Xanthobacteraceae bacterium]|jgi:chromosome partitioning protein|nr:ParA family protein [Xanthobacteraceae bacterium]
MNVIVFASRKGGSGKSTLTVHVASHAARRPRRCLLVDADPQGSASLWRNLRQIHEPPLRDGSRGVVDILRAAKREGYEWVFVDTPPSTSTVVAEAIRAATLVVIPVRLAVFDLAAVRETIDFARKSRRPYALVINAAPPTRNAAEAAFVTKVREVLHGLNIPVWSGQITQRADYAASLESGEGVREYDPRSSAAGEIAALWSAIEKSVQEVRAAYARAAAARRNAA